MPNSNTFQIKPIKELIEKYANGIKANGGIIIDAFANNNRVATVTNDLDPQYNTDFHMEATEFLKLFNKESIDMVLYDPPYSTRQLSECYRKLDRSVTMQDTQSSYWSKQKSVIAEILKPGGYAISFGWNSNGIGKTNGFEIVEILMVAHGGIHNDTICVVERKLKQ